MAETEYGGLTSVTGSVGGGGDGSRHDDDRGIFFPEYNQWALQNKVGLKINTKSSIGDRGRITETLTMIIDFNDGAWRPSSTVIAHPYLPKVGDVHPTIEGCKLLDVSISSDQGQMDLFKATLKYGFPREEDGSIRLDGNVTPLDQEFLIEWNPTLEEQIMEEDLDGEAIRNPNGEAYDIRSKKVRLDGIATWTQRDWDFDDSDNWSNKINKGTWTEGNYKFREGTVLVHYVIGNVEYYANSDGRRVPFYRMEAGLSFNSDGWGVGNGTIKQRRQGSFCFLDDTRKKAGYKWPVPNKPYSGYTQFDVDENGILLSGDTSLPTSSSPQYDYFRVYDQVRFNFVDR